MKFDTLNDFSKISKTGVSVIDRSGAEVFSTLNYKQSQCACEYVAELLGVKHKCRDAMRYAGELSNRFGGRYVFLCPVGFVFFASPIILNGEHHLTALGGPILMTTYEDYIDVDVQYRIPSEAGFDKARLMKLLCTVPTYSAGHVNTLSEQLFVNSAHLSSGRAVQNTPEEKDNRLQEYLDSFRYRKDNQNGFIEERRLIDILTAFEGYPAQALLNEILGHILFHSGKNLEFVKVRVLELIGVLSESAVRDGADEDVINILCKSCSDKIYEIDNIEDIISWLNGILEQFSVFSLANPGSKHANSIRDTINYINRNYNKRLQLDDLARRIYVSPAYFSTLFREETGYTFKAYLNKVRIEQSKVLMQNSAVSLSDIADMVGYDDQSYFTRVFKKYVGKSPNHYRQSISKRRC